ncbi:Phosphonate ABC transporter phosphate-binding periplasmic component [Collimonas arenae]|uniref:Phosphonate ABC transporter phosphate-binding periplasmic component n=1 Tax=Collimonas arenae TaxID=279058 RepID=A0A0A1FLY1_9BURK|nr:transglutaminase family protein [Collimonas arenae]AIY43962.1 Phosphonate ABC transporter phosphate-binding periplasmic component [Collimonas arenae]
MSARTLDDNPYLAFSTYIDGDHPAVASKAVALASGCATEEEIVKACFEFVRDAIKHSGDFKLNPVTCSASDTLIHGTGYCYAKSHLLAALLRCNGIPTGLCYQRLSVGMEGPSFCLHGLNAVYLKNHGWYRIDARGNKSGVDAQCTPPLERLAFPVLAEQERDLPEIWPEPLPQVVHALLAYSSVLEVAEHLPDIELISAHPIN